ncbi:MAG: SMP-30/gluconolactonase/LRE family protein [Sediminibacterium sp.]
MPLEVVVEHSCLLGEGPVWDARRKCICWVDILEGEIHEYSPGEKMFRTIPVHQMIGAIAVCRDGNFIAAMRNGFGFINRETGRVTMITDPEAHLPGNRFNDGKCDPAGRFWAGTMSVTEDAGAGSLYVLAGELSTVKQIEGVTISNGLAWSRDHQTFYFIDTVTHQVVSYRFDKATGNIADPAAVIEIPKEDGYPDGMTIDAEGMLWIAHWDGWQITRWDPVTGKKLLHVPLPVARVTSCTFGGDNLDDLYITTAKVGLIREQHQKQPLAGSLFVIRNGGYKGMPAVEFG